MLSFAVSNFKIWHQAKDKALTHAGIPEDVLSKWVGIQTRAQESGCG